MASLQPVPSEKLCGLRSGVILGKLCFRYFSWPGKADASARLRL